MRTHMKTFMRNIIIKDQSRQRKRPNRRNWLWCVKWAHSSEEKEKERATRRCRQIDRGAREKGNKTLIYLTGTKAKKNYLLLYKLQWTIVDKIGQTKSVTHFDWHYNANMGKWGWWRKRRRRGKKRKQPWSNHMIEFEILELDQENMRICQNQDKESSTSRSKHDMTSIWKKISIRTDTFSFRSIGICSALRVARCAHNTEQSKSNLCE